MYVQGEGGEAAGPVSLLAERAPTEGPRSTRAVETRPATSCELGNRVKLNLLQFIGSFGVLFRSQ